MSNIIAIIFVLLLGTAITVGVCILFAYVLAALTDNDY
jgi:hypothetical protein